MHLCDYYVSLLKNTIVRCWQRAEDDIYRLLEDLKERKSDAARAEATGLAREFEDIRDYVIKNGGQLADEEK